MGNAIKTFFAALLLSLGVISNASALTCNDPAGFVKSFGTFQTGDIVVFGPNCEQLQDGGGAPSGPIRVVTASTDTPTTVDCGSTLVFSGATQTVETVLSSANYGACKLSFTNNNSYAGPVPGGCGLAVTCTGSNSAGIVMKISGFSDFILYPGQTFTIQSSLALGIWIADRVIASGLGFTWNAPSAITFFVDTAGSDTDTDGLAPGARAFRTLAHCAVVAYSQVYTNNLGGVICLATAGQIFKELVQVFYPMNGGGTITFQGNNGQFIWQQPNSSYALQFGDNALVGIANVRFDPSNTITPAGTIIGHQFGVLDVNSNVTVDLPNAVPVFTCDFESHFNFNNGLVIRGNGAASTTTFLWQGCPGSQWNINNVLTFSGALGVPTLGRLLLLQSTARMIWSGNVTVPAPTVSTSVALVMGNGVWQNLSGVIPPGGAPTPTTGGQYCTAAFTC